MSRAMKKNKPIKSHYKWDMDKARQFYLSGMEIVDILKLPEFNGLSRFYIKNVMIQQKWSHQRQTLRAQASGMIEKKLIDSLRDGSEDHLRFMIKQIAEERAEIVARKKAGNIRDQKERLDLLESLDKTARRTLGLDEQNVADKAAMSVNAMINLHISGPQKDTIEILSETITKKQTDTQNVEDERNMIESIGNDNSCAEDDYQVQDV